MTHPWFIHAQVFMPVSHTNTLVKRETNVWTMIPAERIRQLNDKPRQKGRFVLYWMQSSQRVSWNHALQFAGREADRLDLPLVVLFTLVPRFPEASPAHYRFMLEGLFETGQRLGDLGIRFVLRTGMPQVIVPEYARDAAAVVTDKGYLKPERQWKDAFAGELPCRFTEVETNVVVPVNTASSKEEWSAATFRRKITPRYDRFLVPLEEKRPGKSSLRFEAGDGEERHELESLMTGLFPGSGERSSLPWKGGETAAHFLLEKFVSERLEKYPLLRNDPNAGVLSGMSPYLHFGQISPVEIALRVMNASYPDTGRYLEELIVRRELSINFVHYNPFYDSYEGLPSWSRKTLSDHARDPREYVYSLQELEQGKTHDRYWNAAQREMVLTGKMHGYLRMYWGKKILEWSASPEEAFQTALSLNNRYELDGRDPNGFAGVAWCFGKHDRPWPERRIFGKVRYMNANGLRKKFDPDRYAERIEAQTGQVEREK
jgi:deoxyribodipyrimidine photo-lyase